MIRYFFILSLFGTVSLQAQLVNRVVVAPDYRGGEGMAIKWLTEKGVYPEGFDIYRRSTGEQDWELIGATRIQEPDMDRLRVMNPTLMQSYAIFYEKSFEYVQKIAAHRAVLYLNLSRSEELSRMLGMTYFDEEIQKGRSYQYRVVGKLSDQEEEIGISEVVQWGEYPLLPPPDSIRFTRLPESTVMWWSIDESISATTIIERSEGNGPYEPLFELPTYVSSSRDSLGNLVYPDIYLADNGLDSAAMYRYRLARVDYLAQVGQFSEPIVLKPVDPTPPPAPQTLNVDADDRNLRVSLSWEYPEKVDDLIGFVVYSQTQAEEEVQLLSDTLGVTTLAFDTDLAAMGEYLVSVAAIDRAGNVSVSLPEYVKLDDLVPPMVPGQVAVSQDSGVYRIGWSPSEEADLAGYFVYRAVSDTKPSQQDFRILNGKPIAPASYTDSLGNALTGTLWYAVAAVDTSFNISEISEPARFEVPDFTAPQTPFMTAPVFTEAGVTLHWMPNVDEDLKNWILIRKSETDSVELVVGPEEVQYTDQKIRPGTSYQYYMVAEDVQGNRSPASDPVSVVAPGVDETIFEGILPSALSLKFNKKDQNIKVYWNQSFPEKNLGVVVYKGETEDVLRPVSGQLRTPEFIDSRVKEGKTYYYQLRTYASNGLNKKSEIKNIEIKSSDK